MNLYHFVLLQKFSKMEAETREIREDENDSDFEYYEMRDTKSDKSDSDSDFNPYEEPQDFFIKKSIELVKASKSSDKKFSCDICDKSFSMKQYLSKHKRLHTGGNKSHSCEICDKSFSYKNELAYHQKRNVYSSFYSYRKKGD